MAEKAVSTDIANWLSAANNLAVQMQELQRQRKEYLARLIDANSGQVIVYRVKETYVKRHKRKSFIVRRLRRGKS